MGQELPINQLTKKGAMNKSLFGKSTRENEFIDPELEILNENEIRHPFSCLLTYLHRHISRVLLASELKIKKYLYLYHA